MKHLLLNVLAIFCGLLFQTQITFGQDCEISYKLFTQAQYGTKCTGNTNNGPQDNPGVDQGNKTGIINNPNLGDNLGCYLQQNFQTAFPGGIAIGCPSKQIYFATADDVQKYLPATGTIGALGRNDINNALVGELLTLKMNVGFDRLDPTLSPKAHDPLGHYPMYIASASPSDFPFNSMIVTSFLNIADEVIGGCRTDLSLIIGTTRTYYTLNDIYVTAKRMNESYAKRDTVINPMICPFVIEDVIRPADPAAPAAPADPAATKAKFGNSTTAINSSSSLTSYPNPFNDITSIEINLNYDSPVTMEIYNYSGELVSTVFAGNVKAGEKNTFNFNGSKLMEGAYYCKVTTAQGSLFNKLILVK